VNDDNKKNFFFSSISRQNYSKRKKQKRTPLSNFCFTSTHKMEEFVVPIRPQDLLHNNQSESHNRYGVKNEENIDGVPENTLDKLLDGKCTPHSTR